MENRNQGLQGGASLVLVYLKMAVKWLYLHVLFTTTTRKHHKKVKARLHVFTNSIAMQYNFCLCFDFSVKGKGEKVKSNTCYSTSYSSPEALYNLGSGTWLAWASDTTAEQADIPLPQSATPGLYPVARKLLLISHPVEGRRLSWPDHIVNQQLAVRIEPQPESYESTPTTRCMRLHRQVGVNNLPRVDTW